jgi:hypothetical protein
MMAAAERDLRRTTISLTVEQHGTSLHERLPAKPLIAMLIRDLLEAARRREQPQAELPLQ